MRILNKYLFRIDQKPLTVNLNETGNVVIAGIYNLQLDTGTYSDTKKFSVIMIISKLIK